jgi:hypothetical protein
MASAAPAAGARRRARWGARGEIRHATPSEIAWIAAIPCALVTVLAVVLAGPLLGDALLQPDPAREAFWPALNVRAEPTQHGRFLAGLIGPPLLAAVVLAGARPHARWRLRLPARRIARLTLAGQSALLAFVVVCFAAQNDVGLNADFVLSGATRSYFTWRTLVVAAALPALVLALLRHERIERSLRRRLRETPALRAACLLAAALYTALWLLTAVNLDRSIGATNLAVSAHLLWTLGESFAVLDGRTPLVDFHAQYGQLWAYLGAAPMALLGATVTTYTIAMATGSGLALVAVYATFRRVVRSSLPALALFLPFTATAAFMVSGPPSNRYDSINLYILWPVRYAGPFLLAWLTARHVDRAAPRRAWIVFAAVGLVAVNSMDFGLAGGAATFAALVCAAPPQSWRAAGRLAGQAGAGVLASAALFSLFTLLRSGSLPHFELLLEFGRLYGIGGWAQLPMPVLGLHLAVFLTFAVALVVAAVRVASRDEDRLMTAMLAWIGVFGLAASVYYMGRAHPLTLFHFFAPWGFAVALLLVVAVRDLSARGWRRPTLPQLAVLFGFGLMLCSLPQTPAPGPQLARIRQRTAVPIFIQSPEAVRFVEATTTPGEKVALLTQIGHRLAYETGVVNVSPYTSIEAIPTRQQLERAIDALRAAGGRKLYLPLYPPFLEPPILQAIEQAGFMARRFSPTRSFVEMTDEAASG